MLRLSCKNNLVFTCGPPPKCIFDITCTEKIPVTYKIKTTVPYKFLFEPRTGVLAPNETVTVTVTLKNNHTFGDGSKNKILVLGMAAPSDVSLDTIEQLNEFWMDHLVGAIEKHRFSAILMLEKPEELGEPLPEEPLPDAESNVPKEIEMPKKRFRTSHIAEVLSLIGLAVSLCGWYFSWPHITKDN